MNLLFSLALVACLQAGFAYPTYSSTRVSENQDMSIQSTLSKLDSLQRKFDIADDEAELMDEDYTKERAKLEEDEDSEMTGGNDAKELQEENVTNKYNAKMMDEDFGAQSDGVMKDEMGSNSPGRYQAEVMDEDEDSEMTRDQNSAKIMHQNLDNTYAIEEDNEMINGNVKMLQEAMIQDFTNGESIKDDENIMKLENYNEVDKKVNINEKNADSITPKLYSETMDN